MEVNAELVFLTKEVTRSVRLAAWPLGRFDAMPFTEPCVNTEWLPQVLKKLLKEIPTLYDNVKYVAKKRDQYEKKAQGLANYQRVVR